MFWDIVATWGLAGCLVIVVPWMWARMDPLAWDRAAVQRLAPIGRWDAWLNAVDPFDEDRLRAWTQERRPSVLLLAPCGSQARRWAQRFRQTFPDAEWSFFVGRESQFDHQHVPNWMDT